jgi:hypothetical protein
LPLRSHQMPEMASDLPILGLYATKRGERSRSLAVR